MQTLKEYPAAMIKFPEQPEDIFVFMNDNSRKQYILNLIKEDSPDLNSITAEQIKNYFESRNIELSFNTVECEKNLGKNSWPITYACPECDSMDITHRATLDWDMHLQDWATPAIDEKAHCADCKEYIVAKDILLPVKIDQDGMV